MSKTEVGHRNAAGFFGIIVKVCLCIHIRVVTDNLDGVLVCAYRTVGSKTPEFTVNGSFRCRYKRSAQFQGQICNVIHDTDCEYFLLCVVINGYDLCRSRIFGT